jgi:glyoxylase-like metal-dependent hydrolase (beta-lactamase superfamily II)
MREKLNEWFRIVEIEKAIFCIEEPGHVRSFLINGETVSALIDTGMGFKDIYPAIEPFLREKTIVLNTHWHFDHIGGNAAFPEIGISQVESRLIEIDLPNHMLQRLYLMDCLARGALFPSDFLVDRYEIKGSRPTFFISDGDRFDLGNRTLEAIATPGHTHGSMSFLDELTQSLFSGDVLYQGTLYLHFEDSNLNAYMTSLQKLRLRYNDFHNIFPSHNDDRISKSFITTVLENMVRIPKGECLDKTVEVWGHRVRQYEFENFSILTKMPDSEGIRLLDFMER